MKLFTALGAGTTIMIAVLALASCTGPSLASAPDAKPHADAGPAVYIVNLHDGDVVSSPFRVVFGLYGYGVAPAGVDKAKTGHHHLLIDTTLSAEEKEYAIPSDAQHRHFGGGQTEVVLDLPTGKHTLQLMLGDYSHVPLANVRASTPITIEVK
ncbi:MAG: DUF4399 domain-containing protein [Robiginitomaculum sp.]|nr:DUF4399 domain-containing protein [Robiginitomaculum sp.]MDQ7077970.1 DUF4399 domain-containing protein [Robiginitomaculum sp.]